jgi:hypothetical protein
MALEIPGNFATSFKGVSKVFTFHPHALSSPNSVPGISAPKMSSQFDSNLDCIK